MVLSMVLGATSDSIFTEIRVRNISFTPTLSAYDHYAPKGVPAMKKTIKRASELQVPIIVGTDYPASYAITAVMTFLRR